jgi:hypothetical protein
MTRPLIFVGPTLSGASALASSVDALFTVRPPIERGDVRALLGSGPPGTLVIVDGRFQQALAVGHAELRDALAAGWAVWGLSSMGAIRAFEMRDFGMRGYGDVYACFSEADDFQDDEVAMLHSPEPPYTLVSEPLVHLRQYLAHLEADRMLPAAAAASVIDSLKRRWFGDRTLPLLGELLAQQGVSMPRIQRDLDHFDRFRVKTRDLQAFVSARAWELPRAS